MQSGSSLPDHLNILRMGISMDCSNVEVEPRVAVIGVGGAGCNIVSYVYDGFPEADAIAVNTDKEALGRTRADMKVYICKSVTIGEGAKGDSLLGRRCAQAHVEELENIIYHYDAVFIAAGMGGGHGTGAAPSIAEISQRLGKMTFAFAISPFDFETARRNTASAGLTRLRSVCGNVISIENENALRQMPDASLNTVFKAVNRTISNVIAGSVKRIKSCFLEEIAGIWEEEAENRSSSQFNEAGIGSSDVMSDTN